MSALDHPEWMSGTFASWYGVLLPRLIERVQAVITISDFSRQRILAYCPDVGEKIHVTPLAAGDNFVRRADDTVAQTLKKLEIPSARYLVALGSLQPRKNISRLLRIWSSLVHRLPADVWLVLAGAKGARLVFGDTSIAALPPRVHLTGHVADDMLPSLYSGALASIYVSLYEGFGLPALEALACGSPSLVSNTTSLPEVVGNAAIAVDPKNDGAIASAIIALVEDSTLRERLSYEGVKRAASFSWQRTADVTWKILKAEEA